MILMPAVASHNVTTRPTPAKTEGKKIVDAHIQEIEARHD